MEKKQKKHRIKNLKHGIKTAKDAIKETVHVFKWKVENNYSDETIEKQANYTVKTIKRCRQNIKDYENEIRLLNGNEI